MLLHVVHETRYDYAPKVKTAQHMAHLKPARNAHQELLRHSLTVEPAPAQQGESVDVYGNTRAFFSLRSSHDALRVVADSVVSTSAPGPAACTLAWEQARERMRYHRSASYDPASEFLFASPHVPRQDEFLAYARPSFTPGRPLAEAVQELMQRIHAEFEYEADA
ncbi:MAG: transglutaminase family protein, partial [Comamonadaceae bacterium]